MNEATLIAQAHGGSTAAFAALVDRHAVRAYRIAYVIVGNHHDAEDVVQESCITAFRSLGSLREAEAFGPWFGRIVANRARDLVRQQQARRRRDQAAAMADGQDGLAEPGPEAAVDLKAAIASLPEPHREVILLYYGGDLTAGEVAACLHRPPGTVRRLLSEAYTRLRQKPGRPNFWRRAGMAAKLELVAACILLVAIGSVFALRNLPGQTGPQNVAAPNQGTEAPGPTQQNPDPSASFCDKPEDTSGVTIFLYKGDGDSTSRIQPGWTVPFAAHWFGVGVQFPRAFDPASITVTTDRTDLQIKPGQGQNVPPNLYLFTVVNAQKPEFGDLCPGLEVAPGPGGH